MIRVRNRVFSPIKNAAILFEYDVNSALFQLKPTQTRVSRVSRVYQKKPSNLRLVFLAVPITTTEVQCMSPATHS